MAASRYQLAEGVTFQTMGEGEDTVVLALSAGQLYSCNDTATVLLQTLQAGGGLDDAVERLCAEFEVSRAEAEADLSALAGELLAEGLIVEAS